MKSKLIVVLLAVLTVVSISYGYYQRKEAEHQRAMYQEMHREMLRLKQESEAARAEAAKLRGMIEIERQKTEQALQELQAKKK